MGQVYNGGFTIKLQGVDMGSLYSLPTGTSAGFGQGGSSASVAAGITALDAIDVGATGAIGSEDSWGIARIEGIFADDSFQSRVWSSAGKNQELTILFYGEQDYYVSQRDPQTFLTNGVGLRADFYLQSTGAGYTPYNVALGAGGRTAFNQYMGVTDGTMVLSTVSTAGFLNAPGINGGTAAEFASLFNSTSLIGEGSTYLSIVGGTDAAKYNTNSYVSSFLTTTADLKASFTTKPPSGAASAAGWLVDVNDPIVGLTANTPVPEPSTYGLIGAAALLGIAAYRRRSMKRAQA